MTSSAAAAAAFCLSIFHIFCPLLKTRLMHPRPYCVCPFPCSHFFSQQRREFFTRVSCPPPPTRAKVTLKGCGGREGRRKEVTFLSSSPSPPPSVLPPPLLLVPRFLCTHNPRPPPQTNPLSLRRILFLLLHLGAPDAKAFSRRVIHPPSGSRHVRLS